MGRRGSTASSDQNQNNEAYLHALKSNSQSFINNLKHTVFEDCEENEVILQIKQYIEENAFATYLWLHYIYSNHQNDSHIIAGLLRIIGTLDLKNDEDLLLPMAIAALNHNSSEAQEAAVMVMENWRTQNCLDALKNTQFASEWMKAYATSVIEELEEELREC